MYINCQNALKSHTQQPLTPQSVGLCVYNGTSGWINRPHLADSLGQHMHSVHHIPVFQTDVLPEMKGVNRYVINSVL